jgi:LPS export ABC transporter protein LptC/lipopolysaccharide transport protein LptA
MATVIDTRDAREVRRARPPAEILIAERAKAFALANRHSRLVRLLRLSLPAAAALVLFGYITVLTVNWHLSSGRFSVGAITITADDLTMKDAGYSGTTKEGGRYEVRSRRAVVSFNQNAPIKLIDVTGELFQTNNVTTKLKSKHGILDNAKGELELYDGIEIDASNGLVARLVRAKVYNKENRIVSNDPVSASTPTGSVQAASMVMNTKTHLTKFKGSVAVRMMPASSQTTLAVGKDARAPVDINSEELDVDDTRKTAHFRGNVSALQGDTMLNTPYLFVKYEGKGSGMLGAEKSPDPAADKGARVKFLWARNGVDLTMSGDRRVTSELADFDVAADTAMFAGRVNVNQGKNTLRGGKLNIDRKSGKSRLEPEDAGPSAGRVAASFHQNTPAGHAKQPRAPGPADALFGSFKTDPNAPMNVEANLLDIYDASKKAVFTGNVVAQQGDLTIRTVELTAFYSGGAAFGAGDGGDDKSQSQLVRVETKHKVVITSKDDRTAIAEWANFDVKANTALLGGGVTVVRGKDIAEGPRLKIDLTTGMYRFEVDSEAAAADRKGGEPPPPAIAPAVPSAPVKAEDRTCPPGKQCMLFYPKDVKDKAKELLKKKNAPAPEASSSQ